MFVFTKINNGHAVAVIIPVKKFDNASFEEYLRKAYEKVSEYLGTTIEDIRLSHFVTRIQEWGT